MKETDSHKFSGHGIRRQVMLYLVLFVAFVIGLLWLFQIVLLDDFYHIYKRRQLTATAELLARNINDPDLALLAEHLAEKNDVCILILDSYRVPIVSADSLRYCLVHHMSAHDLDFWTRKAPDDGSACIERFSVRARRNNRFNAERFVGAPPILREDDNQSLLYTQRITRADQSQVTLLLNVIVTPLGATVSTLRFQLLTITLIVLVGALLLAVLISRRVSQPIIETNAAAKALSRSAFAPPPHSSSYREIAELNQTLSHAAEELGKVEALQHELIANISHDLRTPLTMIGGYAEVMRDLPDENTPENMQIIIDESARLSTLVNELLDFSRMQTGSAQLNLTVFDLTSTVESIITRIGKLTEKDGYVIRFEPSAHLFTRADETRIGQVIYNLLGNALTYTGDDRTVCITQEAANGKVFIRIHDTGRGIAPEELPLIWNRYYRTKETHRRSVVGSGLGLNIVRSILETHGAEYGVESGDGTTFWFALPLADAEG